MKGCWRGKGGGGGFVAHLLHLAAANTAPARPQRSKSTHPAKPASGRRRSEVKSFQFQELGRGHPTQPKRHPTPTRAD